ncbi:hypothetical protein AC578_5852 [Pseudocercospora eumusae]|uniref:Uncharacterized protein n=1 Tax=Pseudocercospora eumusae TaxID=321146 RepID=A0A139GXU6_9PEZI|nr:hypothetical protein AC578_5852 [Pseudocercospora eumusae]
MTSDSRIMRCIDPSAPTRKSTEVQAFLIIACIMKFDGNRLPMSGRKRRSRLLMVHKYPAPVLSRTYDSSILPPQLASRMHAMDPHQLALTYTKAFGFKKGKNCIFKPQDKPHEKRTRRPNEPSDFTCQRSERRHDTEDEAAWEKVKTSCWDVYLAVTQGGDARLIHSKIESLARLLSCGIHKRSTGKVWREMGHHIDDVLVPRVLELNRAQSVSSSGSSSAGSIFPLQPSGHNNNINPAISEEDWQEFEQHAAVAGQENLSGQGTHQQQDWQVFGQPGTVAGGEILTGQGTHQQQDWQVFGQPGTVAGEEILTGQGTHQQQDWQVFGQPGTVAGEETLTGQGTHQQQEDWQVFGQPSTVAGEEILTGQGTQEQQEAWQIFGQPSTVAGEEILTGQGTQEQQEAWQIFGQPSTVAGEEILTGQGTQEQQEEWQIFGQPGTVASEEILSGQGTHEQPGTAAGEEVLSGQEAHEQQEEDFAVAHAHTVLDDQEWERMIQAL